MGVSESAGLTCKSATLLGRGMVEVVQPDNTAPVDRIEAPAVRRGKQLRKNAGVGARITSWRWGLGR